ncbi:MAG: SAM-dependent methyltransferase [Methanosphaera sp. rholeuAM270]|nr:MAG: SAM-dependent methyltransferase [Methanosphaera sp. rholeuAM270]
MSENECIICNSSLEYLKEDVLMECALCKKSELTKVRCINGHYVCDECHIKGLNSIVEICLNETSCNPIVVLDKLMSLPFCHMHGPEHHSLVGASLLTAYSNCGGDIDLEDSLIELIKRSKQVPGGVCGFWGACGAGISCGIFVSVISESTPLSVTGFKLSNKMTSLCLDKISEFGGPRCCKRDSYLAVKCAVDFVAENFGIKLEDSGVLCKFSDLNLQCLREDCPFYDGISSD